jgi:periplasmic protein TonB
MFDDFRPNPQARRAARRRFQASLAAAALVFGVSSAAAISATSGIRARLEDEEELLPVEFAPAVPEPPAPPAETAPPPPTEAPKPPEKPKPRKLTPPKQVSATVLPESDRALPEAAPAGPVDGIAGGTGVGPSRPPPPPPPPVIKPVKPPPVVLPVAQSTPRPKYSAMARRKGIEGVVTVEFDVLENGSVANVKVISGPPEFWESVVKTVGDWRFKPASRSGRALRYRLQQRIVFSLQDA